MGLELNSATHAGLTLGIVLESDGTYTKAHQAFKHILGFVSS